MSSKIGLATAALALRAQVSMFEQRFGPRSPFVLEARANFAIAWLEHARAQRNRDLLAEALGSLVELSRDPRASMIEDRPLRESVSEACDLADRLHLSMKKQHREQTQAPTRQVAINDIGSTEDLLAAIDETFKYFEDGDIVDGTVVQVDRDEVLLDIGYKTEGVIPTRELSIRNDVDPHEVVSVGDHLEALVL